MPDFKDCIFITSWDIADDFFNPFTMPSNIDYFLEYVGYYSNKANLTPESFKKLEKASQGKDSMSYLESVFQDGGILIGKNTTFGNEFDDITFLACHSSITNPDKNVCVVLTEEQLSKFVTYDFTKIHAIFLKTHPKGKIAYSIMSVNSMTNIAKGDRDFSSYVTSRFSGSY